jgi:hypothetical protein
MGRLLRVHQCAVCNYYLETDLHHGGSGISTTFLRNHYTIAICRNCQNIVSVLVANTPDQMRAANTAARRALVQMEADSIVGDSEALELLPIFREALDTLDENEPGAVGQCDLCSSTDLELFDDIDPVALDANEVWIHCPRCAEGKILLETSGEWM